MAFVPFKAGHTQTGELRKIIHVCHAWLPFLEYLLVIIIIYNINLITNNDCMLIASLLVYSNNTLRSLTWGQCTFT